MYFCTALNSKTIASIENIFAGILTLSQNLPNLMNVTLFQTFGQLLAVFLQLIFAQLQKVAYISILSNVFFICEHVSQYIYYIVVIYCPDEATAPNNGSAEDFTSGLKPTVISLQVLAAIFLGHTFWIQNVYIPLRALLSPRSLFFPFFICIQHFCTRIPGWKRPVLFDI